MATSNYSWNLPTVGGSEDAWGTQLNANWTDLDTLLGGVSNTELSILDGATVSTAELNILDGVTASTAELNILDGVTASTAELNILDGVTASTAELNILDGVTATTAELNILDGVTASTAEINLLSGQTSLVPAGVIVMWSGSVASIPTGWLLCNGTNGTPDLRNRFVVGAGSTYAVGNTGGADSVTLTEAQIPGHTHSGNTASAGLHSHTINNAYGVSVGTVVDGYFDGSTSAGGVAERNLVLSQTTDTQGNHVHSFTTGSTGGGNSHENRPPYYALAYIMKA
jgi:microcystin-dependent protein